MAALLGALDVGHQSYGDSSRMGSCMLRTLFGVFGDMGTLNGRGVQGNAFIRESRGERTLPR